jgi:hypothetical protein
MNSFGIVFEEDQKQGTIFEDGSLLLNQTIKVDGWSPRGEDSMLHAMKMEEIGKNPSRRISDIAVCK